MWPILATTRTARTFSLLLDSSTAAGILIRRWDNDSAHGDADMDNRGFGLLLLLGGTRTFD
jgi:hypothetical protein